MSIDYTMTATTLAGDMTHVDLFSLVADLEVRVDAELVDITDDRHVRDPVLRSGACKKVYTLAPVVLNAPATPPFHTRAVFAERLHAYRLPSVTNFGRSSTDAIPTR